MPGCYHMNEIGARWKKVVGHPRRDRRVNRAQRSSRRRNR